MNGVLHFQSENKQTNPCVKTQTNKNYFLLDW